MASATLMNRFAKSVNKMGSGLFGSPMVTVVRADPSEVVEVITLGSPSHRSATDDDLVRSKFPRLQRLFGAYATEGGYKQRVQTGPRYLRLNVAVENSASIGTDVHSRWSD